jgi:hypothetical protein
MKTLIFSVLLFSSAHVFGAGNSSLCDVPDKICAFLKEHTGGIFAGEFTTDPDVQSDVYQSGTDLLERVEKQMRPTYVNTKKVLLLNMKLSCLENDEYATEVEALIQEPYLLTHKRWVLQAYREIMTDKTFDRDNQVCFCEAFSKVHDFLIANQMSCPLPKYDY